MMQLTINNFNVRETSKECYQALLQDDTIGCQMKQYLRLLSGSPRGMTDRETSKLLGLDCSTISARRNDIIKKYGGVICVDGRRTNPTGKKALIWKINDYWVSRQYE